MTTALRPLSLGELLDRAFHLYGRYFVVFVGISAMPQLVVLAFQLVLDAPQPTATGQLPSLPQLLSWLLMQVALGLAAVVATMISQAATIVAVSSAHLDRPVSIVESYRPILGRLFMLCLLTIGLSVLIGIGTLFFIIPGILLALRWALAVPVAVLEDTSFLDATSRSAELTEGQRGRIFLIYCLSFVMTLVIAAILSIPAVATSVAAARTHALTPAWVRTFRLVGNFLTSVFVGPVLTITMSLVYYDQRVRKEAFDLEHMMTQIDTPGGPASSRA